MPGTTTVEIVFDMTNALSYNSYNNFNSILVFLWANSDSSCLSVLFNQGCSSWDLLRVAVGVLVGP